MLWPGCVWSDDLDDDWDDGSYDNSNNSPEKQEILYDSYSDFARDFDYGFVISDGEIWAGEKRFESDYLVCMDPDGDYGIRNENCASYPAGTLYPYFEELRKYEIPEGVKKIGAGTFEDCVNLRSVTIPDSVTTIEKYAFKNCRSLTNITIPDSVTFIGYEAFSGCSSLERSSFPDWIFAKWGNAFDYRLRRPSDDGFQIDGHTLISYSGAGGDVTIPYVVTVIGKSAFYNCSSLTSVTIPNGVTAIGESAFEGCCSLTKVTIPDSVTFIGKDAFSLCNRLKRSSIPDRVITAFNNAFDAQIGKANDDGFQIDGHTLVSYYGAGGDVTIPDGVTTIGEEAFWACSSLKSVTIPNGVTSIGESAFRGCSCLASITIPNGVTSIGENALMDCVSLSSITIPRRLEWKVIGYTSGRNIKFSD